MRATNEVFQLILPVVSGRAIAAWIGRGQGLRVRGELFRFVKSATHGADDENRYHLSTSVRYVPGRQDATARTANMALRGGAVSTSKA